MPELQQEARDLRERIDAEVATEDELRAVRVQILERLEAPRPRRLAWGMSFAGAAAMVIAAIVLWPSESTWFESDATCLIAIDHDTLSTDGCNLPTVISVADDQITLDPSTRILKGQRSFLLAHGRATFEVAKREREQPFRVRVSNAEIVVVGTRFTAEQRGPDTGSVTVSEGIVEVQWGDGESNRVSAGESFSWPRREPKPEPVDEPEPEPALGVPPDGKIKRHQPDVRTIMERLFQLRSQRRYSEAVRMLKAASRRRDLSKEQRERLSYEAGNVLRQADENDQACAHFRKHLKRFPNSAKRDDALSTCAPAPSEGN